MKKRKDKVKLKDVIFIVGVAVIVTIVGVGATNVIKGQGVLGGRTIQILIGDEVLVDVEESEEETFGGMVFIAQRDFPDGISVDGTEVINGSGDWVGDIVATTTTASQPAWGASDVAGCFKIRDTDYGGTSYVTVLNGTMTTTGGASGAFSIPAACQ